MAAGGDEQWTPDFGKLLAHCRNNPEAPLDRVLIVGLVAFAEDDEVENGKDRVLEEWEIENVDNLVKNSGLFFKTSLRGVCDVRYVVGRNAIALKSIHARHSDEENPDWFRKSTMELRSRFCDLQEASDAVDGDEDAWCPTFVVYALFFHWGLEIVPEEDRMGALHPYAVSRGHEALLAEGGDGEWKGLPRVRFVSGSRALGAFGDRLGARETDAVRKAAQKAINVIDDDSEPPTLHHPQPKNIHHPIYVGQGIITQEAWVHAEVPTCCAVVAHEAMGHGTGMMHPSTYHHRDVMSHGIYVPESIHSLHMAYGQVIDQLSLRLEDGSVARIAVPLDPLQEQCEQCREERRKFLSVLRNVEESKPEMLDGPRVFWSFENGKSMFLCEGQSLQRSCLAPLLVENGVLTPKDISEETTKSYPIRWTEFEVVEHRPFHRLCLRPKYAFEEVGGVVDGEVRIGVRVELERAPEEEVVDFAGEGSINLVLRDPSRDMTIQIQGSRSSIVLGESGEPQSWWGGSVWRLWRSPSIPPPPRLAWVFCGGTRAFVCEGTQLGRSRLGPVLGIATPKHVKRGAVWTEFELAEPMNFCREQMFPEYVFVENDDTETAERREDGAVDGLVKIDVLGRLGLFDASRNLSLAITGSSSKLSVGDADERDWHDGQWFVVFFDTDSSAAPPKSLPDFSEDSIVRLATFRFIPPSLDAPRPWLDDRE